MLRLEETVPDPALPPLRLARKLAKPILPTGIATDQLFASNHFKKFRQTGKHQKAYTPLIVFFHPPRPLVSWTNGGPGRTAVRESWVGGTKALFGSCI